jgi:hypothetical protein
MVSDECIKSDQQLTRYGETHTYGPQEFHIYMDLIMKDGYLIKYRMKLIAVISHGKYYSQFYHLSCEIVQ